MISHCYHICPGGKYGVRLGGKQAVAGGVFPAHHGEVDIMELAQGGQVPGEKVHPGVAHHVANS